MTADPVTLLRQAADHLELRAEAATPGPWVRDAQARICSLSDQVECHPDGRLWTLAIPRRIEDAEWITVMHPGIAKPLVGLLRSEADAHQDDLAPGFANGWMVDLARAILGEER